MDDLITPPEHSVSSNAFFQAGCFSYSRLESGFFLVLNQYPNQHLFFAPTGKDDTLVLCCDR